MTEHHLELDPEVEAETNDEIDADVNGHLTAALFGGVIVIIMIMIYAQAIAA